MRPRSDRFRFRDVERDEREAEAIALTGMQHMLILTGEDRRTTPPEYLGEAVAVFVAALEALAAGWNGVARTQPATTARAKASA